MWVGSTASEVERIDLVEHVEEVLLGVDARALDAGQRLADHLLARRRAGRCGEALEVGNQLAVDEGEEAADLPAFELLAHRAAPGDAQSRQRKGDCSEWAKDAPDRLGRLLLLSLPSRRGRGGRESTSARERIAARRRNWSGAARRRSTRRRN